MPKLFIRNLQHLAIEINPLHSLLKNIQRMQIDWMQACGGKGRCTTCKIRILSGMEHLSEPTAHEQRFRTAGRLRHDERLTCQAHLLEGDAEGKVPRESKLPHISYSE